MTTDKHNAPSVAPNIGSTQHSAPDMSPSDAQPKAQYSWSVDEETYRDQCDSIEEAVAAALDHHGGLEIGTTISIGEIIPVDASQLVDADSVIDNMSCQAYDLAGEPSEDYLGSVTKEQKSELEALIAAWADRIEKPAFWQIGTIYVHTVTAQDLGESCESGQPECGPVTNHDSEGVPLCAVCWEGLLADSQDGDAVEVKS